jgi:hypothetical protein
MKIFKFFTGIFYLKYVLNFLKIDFQLKKIPLLKIFGIEKFFYCFFKKNFVKP